jgi:hypothetical protein
LESIQGRLWRGVAYLWIGSMILVLPLLRAMAVEQPLWSLGPFGGDWEVALAIALVGMAVMVVAFASLVKILRGAAKAADEGFGTLTILEVITDVTRDTGFLIQGMRHFSLIDADVRESLVLMRLRGVTTILAAGLWFSVGFGLAVLLASRGFVTPSGVWLMTLGPTLLLLGGGIVLVGAQHARVRAALIEWTAQEGEEHIREEGRSWARRLDEAEHVSLGTGPVNGGARFRLGATLAIVLCLFTLVPTVTVAVAGGIGPTLASIALPEVLSVQELAGRAEVLRAYRMEADASIDAGAAGSALQNIGFVGTAGSAEPWERPPTVVYEGGWFPESGAFPDPFSESVAADLMATELAEFTPEEQAALRQAAAHPAHEAFHLLAQATLVDIVSGRWTLPFPDTLSYASLPWPRFAAFRTAGLAQVAKAAVEVADGRPAQAEITLRELISTGFLLIDQGPTLIDNLMGVVLTNLGGDALEAYYRRTGQAAQADALAAVRQGAANAVRRARAGLLQEDVHALLQGIPALVENEDALRGARWEYFATFNMLAPCMNLNRMVFGHDESYSAWRLRARDALVRVDGERELFELAEGTFWGRGGQQSLRGFLPRFLSLTLGSGGSPGSCASLIALAGSVR